MISMGFSEVPTHQFLDMAIEKKTIVKPMKVMTRRTNNQEYPTQSMYVWYKYLHLVDFYDKCR